MGEETRVITRRLRRRGQKHRFLSVLKRGDFYVLYNHLTRSKKYYARITDVKAILDRPAGGLEEESA